MTTGLVDCDVHPHFTDGLQDLMPYMSDTWRQRLGIGVGSATGNFAASSFVLPLDVLYINSAGAYRSDAGTADMAPGTDARFVAEQLLDGLGVDRAILIAGHLLGLGAMPDANVAAVIASAYNEWLTERWLQEDGRYRGALAVAPQDPEAAVREIERVADRPGMVGIFMPLHYLLMGEKHYYPIYEAAERHGLPITVHPSGTENVFAQAPRMAGTPTYYLEWHTALGQIHQSNVLSLICHGVFERFPKLRIVVAEGGFAWIAETMWKLDRDWKGLRDEVPWLKRPPSEYLLECIRFTTQPFVEPHKAEHVASLLDMVDAGTTLLFSSDYPHWDFDNPTRVLKGMSAALRQRVCVDNATAIYGDRL